MAEVRILPEILSNKIAAGEVVERPVSVVKELMENALDAGASRVTVEIEKGGRDLVRVSDDGCGMSRDNALLSIERYATSKLVSDEDLFSISTFGFRGEAVPSIAAVSDFILTTREPASHVGTRIRIRGGKLLDVSDAGVPPGTQVEVKRLYFNTPARRKFMKTITTEMAHIADFFSGMALGCPGIHFRLIHNGRAVKQFAASDDMLRRTADVLGVEKPEQLRQMHYKNGDIQVSGYVSDPTANRSTSGKIQLFVNGRMISDRGLVSAVLKGYRGRLMTGRFPLAAVFVTLPFDGVDVNVHPAKLQVRFAEPPRVYETVASGVHAALSAAEKSIFSPFVSDGLRPSSQVPSAGTGTDDPPNENSPSNREIVSRHLAGSPGSDRAGIADSEPVDRRDLLTIAPLPSMENDSFSASWSAAVREVERSWETPDSDPGPGDKTGPRPLAETPMPPEQRPEDIGPDPGTTLSRSEFGEFRVIGQVLGSYILAEIDNGLLLVDQHAAHERIVYEKLKKRSGSFRPPCQQLMVPETLELGFREAAVLESMIPDLFSLGMEIEVFGETTFLIKAVPAIIDHRMTLPLVREMVEMCLDSGLPAGGTPQGTAWLDSILILMACHSSLRARHTLSQREMEELLRDLDRCETPLHCPHGRPTRILWTGPQIEKLFKRVV